MPSTLPLPEWCPPYSPKKKEPVTQQEVYCICKKPDEGELMVGCDGCDDWFHFKCMKIPEVYRSLVFAFFCPYCQSGITGKNKDNFNVELPRTLWKRKCRLSSCYEPCEDKSKYCSEAHGLLYMQNLVANVSRDSNLKEGSESQDDLLKQMVSYSNGDVESFKNIGKESFIDEDLTVDAEVVKEIVDKDQNLNELRSNLDECDTITLPRLKENLEVLQKYIDWLTEVNLKLNYNEEELKAREETMNLNNGTNSKKRSKNGNKNTRVKSKKNICGYTADIQDFNISVDDFIAEYKGNQEKEEPLLQVYNICVKAKCNKHSDWTSMKVEQVKQQMRSLDTYRERLEILIRTRKRQLHVQSYEKLIELGIQP
ncbi:hypothetical protein KAFR_0H02560 [Kazachstania africana CBS 2517]|uniref:PHD-type domain-containing protein n=1 Tax=Kazachstania africana (strain ATCC 22294 / BCRC 22015 / CBS 2517 / CECT 1963 / NBRC 1671 / NRRL Y-8276) TaxID=1071382 RepID=H2AZA9_KAZAF|nr:hypothetical protein KAFR_0H02560 [Kazachstania africana CBS 2517]CCF59665.1 hypothetical protein KAFR_0H02560 [Kazachstania africana CBS 2517]